MKPLFLEALSVAGPLDREALSVALALFIIAFDFFHIGCMKWCILSSFRPRCLRKIDKK